MNRKKKPSIQQEFAKVLAEKIPNGKPVFSKSRVPLFFAETEFSQMFVNAFGINEVDSFRKAFTIATAGVGNEIDKINSVASSALLPLLIFHPLFEEKKHQLKIKLDGIEDVVFDKVFFEVRNKVIGRPSCVDVVLQSTDKDTLLFLESKLSEYIDDIKGEKTYGKSYLPLYQSLYDKGLLTGFNAPIEVKDKMLLTTPTECYIEGIKQSISHLIGIVQGPMDVTDNGYPKEYLEAYKTAYQRAKYMIYGTILFDPSSLDVGTTQYDAYHKLYDEVIGKNGDEIVKAIKEWKNITSQTQIKVLKSALSYQEILDGNEYTDIIPENVKSFYRLNL